MSHEQLLALTKPIGDKVVHKNPSGYGDYISHAVIKQKLLLDHGPYSWRIKHIIRGYVPEQRGKDPLHEAVVGVVGELELLVDGHPVVIQGAGDCEDPQNWPHDGARLKDAESDAFKRAAMNIGPGLQLWSATDGYWLHQQLAARYGESEATDLNTSSTRMGASSVADEKGGRVGADQEGGGGARLDSEAPPLPSTNNERGPE